MDAGALSFASQWIRWAWTGTGVLVWHGLLLGCVLSARYGLH